MYVILKFMLCLFYLVGLEIGLGAHVASYGWVHFEVAGARYTSSIYERRRLLTHILLKQQRIDILRKKLLRCLSWYLLHFLCQSIKLILKVKVEFEKFLSIFKLYIKLRLLYNL